MNKKSKKTFNKKLVKIIIAVIVLALAVYGVYWGVDKYKDHQRKVAAEQKMADYKAQIDKDPKDAKAWLNYGKLLHDANRIDEAIVALRKVLELVPNSPAALGYLGSSLTKKADKVSDLAEKMEYLQEGLDIMDKNIEDHPDNFIARFIRAENNYYLPAMFERIGTSVEDFEKLIPMSEKEDRYKDLKPYLMFRLGQSYKKAGRPADAQKIFEEVIQKYPDSYNAKQAKKALKTLK